MCVCALKGLPFFLADGRGSLQRPSALMGMESPRGRTAAVTKLVVLHPLEASAKKAEGASGEGMAEANARAQTPPPVQSASIAFYPLPGGAGQRAKKSGQ